jgi:uncharacterized membrane protein
MMPIDTKLTYSFTTIDVPSSSSVSATGINDGGQVVGYYVDPVRNQALGFIFRDGHFAATGIADPGTGGFQPVDINNFGQLLGYSGEHSVLYSHGTFSDLQLKFHSTASGFNDLGQIVGQLSFSHGVGSFVYSNGNYTDVRVPGAFRTLVADINDRGVIVGTYGDHPAPPYTHGFVDTGGKYVTVDVPGAISTSISDINNLGQLVGSFVDAAGHGHGYVDVKGRFTTIDVPTSTYTQVTGINDFGQIVGSFGDTSGHSHGFIARITPYDLGGHGNPSFLAGDDPDRSLPPVPGTDWMKGATAGSIIASFVGNQMLGAKAGDLLPSTGAERNTDTDIVSKAGAFGAWTGLGGGAMPVFASDHANQLPAG